MPDRGERRRYPVLGVAAYLLVPGDRRKRAAAHFRRAGFEVLLGLGALVEGQRTRAERPQRQKIELD